MTPKIR